jgi:hypothetical protein
LVGLGIKGPVPDALAAKRWLYFSELGVPFHRATILSNYSAAMTPEGTQAWSLLCEISDTPVRPAGRSRLVREVTQHAQRLIDGWDGGAIAHVWSHHLSHGYPTPFLGRDAVLPAVHGGLERLGIFSRGRFGGWRYEVSNQDHAFMQGYEVVSRIVQGEPESTFGLDSSTAVAS